MVYLLKCTSNNNLLNGVTMVKVTPGITLSNVTASNNLLLNSYFGMPLNYMFYMCLTCMPIFMPIKYYLPCDP